MAGISPRKIAGALSATALVALSSVFGTVSSARADGGSPQPTAATASFNQAPTVSEQDTRQLFDDVLHRGYDIMRANVSKYGESAIIAPRQVGDTTDISDLSGAPFSDWQSTFPHLVEGMDNGLNSYLQDRYNAATTDQQRAAIVSFKAMGGIDLEKQAAVDVFNLVFALPSLSLSSSTFNATAAKWENTSRNYAGTNMTFAAEVKQCTNDLLWSVNYGKYKTGNLTTFLQGRAMKDPAFANDIAKAATDLGIRQNGSLVVAMGAPNL